MFLRIFTLCFLLLPASSASAASVDIDLKRGAVDLGEGTRVLVNASEDDWLWQLQAAPFPYKQFSNQGAPRPSSDTEIVVRPSRNTRYRVLLFSTEEQVMSPRRTLFVRPPSFIRNRWNAPFLLSRGWTEIDTYYRELLEKVPFTQRKIYLYARCSSGNWRLRGQSALRAVALGDRIRLDWEISRRISCAAPQYWSVGMILFPGTLPSGDDGLGRPKLSKAEIIKAVSLLGRRRVSNATMKRFWGK